MKQKLAELQASLEAQEKLVNALRKLVKALGAPAPEDTSEPVQEAGDKAPPEEGGAAPEAQDAIEKPQALEHFSTTKWLPRLLHPPQTDPVGKQM